jgi:ribosomal protein L7Ae-like RNA K-turn-binding protein
VEVITEIERNIKSLIIIARDCSLGSTCSYPDFNINDIIKN